jgi:hypothetical protein
MRWRRSEFVWRANARIGEDDWTLGDEAGRRLARLSHHGIDDGEGEWRW